METASHIKDNEESGRAIGDAQLEGTGYSYCLMEYQPVRFNELKRYLGKISDKTLSQNLKELEGDELVRRKVYPQIPPKVEHSLPNQNRQ